MEFLFVKWGEPWLELRKGPFADLSSLWQISTLDFYNQPWISKGCVQKSQRLPKMGQPPLNQREFSNVAFPRLLQVPFKHGDGGL